MLQGLTMQRVDAAAVLCFALVFILSVVAVPFEDQLYYSYKRVPDWWEFETVTAGFTTKLTRFHAVNFCRCFFAALGWLAVCYTVTPAVVGLVYALVINSLDLRLNSGMHVPYTVSYWW